MFWLCHDDCRVHTQWDYPMHDLIVVQYRYRPSSHCFLHPSVDSKNYIHNHWDKLQEKVERLVPFTQPFAYRLDQHRRLRAVEPRSHTENSIRSQLPYLMVHRDTENWIDAPSIESMSMLQG